MSSARLAGRVRACVVGILLLTGCSGDPDSTATRSPEPRPSPTGGAASGTPGPGPTGLLLAVTRADGGLELHRVDRSTRRSALVRVLEPPAEGAEVVDVTRSTAGVVCASWHTGPKEHLSEDRQSVLACYQGSGTPQQVDGVQRPDQVALSPDGRSVAWSEVDTGGNQALVTARLDGWRVTGARRVLARSDQPEEGERAFTGTVVQDLAWAGADSLLVSTAVESDDGPRLLRVDALAENSPGWLAADVVPVPPGDYFAYDSVSSADASRALAVQRGSWMHDDAPPSRAVVVELTGGRVLDVVATAAQGRAVVAVTGSVKETVYATAAGGEPLKVYLRRSGEERGTPVRGLPPDVTDVVAVG